MEFNGRTEERNNHTDSSCEAASATTRRVKGHRGRALATMETLAPGKPSKGWKRGDEQRRERAGRGAELFGFKWEQAAGLRIKSDSMNGEAKQTKNGRRWDMARVSRRGFYMNGVTEGERRRGNTILYCNQLWSHHICTQKVSNFKPYFQLIKMYILIYIY